MEAQDETGATRPGPDQSAEIGELVKALAAARAGFQKIEREQTAGKEGGKRWRYATLDAAIEATAGALAEHGLVVMQLPDSAETGGVIVETMLLHASGQWIRSRLRMPCGPEPQSVGSAITYARRYAYLAMLGLAPADDDDGQKAQQSAQRAAARRPAQGQAPRVETPAAVGSAAPEPGPAETPAPTWRQAWDAIRAEVARVGEHSEPIGYDYASRILLPQLAAQIGWTAVGVERAVAVELSVLLEDLPRVDAKRRPFAQTWIARALRRFQEAEILAEYDRRAESEGDGGEPAASDGERPATTAASAVPAAVEPARPLAEILDRLSGAHEDFPGEDEAAAWNVIRDVRDLLEQHHPAQLTARVAGAAKMAIYRKQDTGWRSSAGAEAVVKERLGLASFVDLPEILAPAAAAALAAFPARGARPASARAPAAAAAAPTNGHASPEKMPAGWRAMDGQLLGQLVKAMVAKGQIQEEDLPGAGVKLSKADAIALVEAAVRRHGITEEGGG